MAIKAGVCVWIHTMLQSGEKQGFCFCSATLCHLLPQHWRQNKNQVPFFAQREIEEGGGGMECKTRCFVSAFWLAKKETGFEPAFFATFFILHTHTHMHKLRSQQSMGLCMFPLSSVFCVQACTVTQPRPCSQSV